MTQKLSSGGRPRWLVVVWLGAVASVVAWAWAWRGGGGAGLALLPLVLAGASIVLAWRASGGARWALVLLVVAGLGLLAFAGVLLVLLIALSAGQPRYQTGSRSSSRPARQRCSC